MTDESEAKALLSKDEAEAWFGPWRFALMLFLLFLAAYPEVLTGQNTFFYRDFVHSGYPWAAYQRDCFWHGELPFWDPLNNSGIPFLAQWCTLSLYPLALFYLLLPLSWSLGVFCLGHIFLGGVGMYFLARGWTGSSFAGAIAGVALAFNGMVVNAIQWPDYCAAFGWMPWVVWLTERAWSEGGTRRILPAVLVGTLQMLTGAPELILLTWLLVLAIHLGQLYYRRGRRTRSFLRFVTVVAAVGALAAIQLLPFFDLLLHSQREPGFAKSGLWSMPVWGWANFLVPLFFTFPWTHGVFFQYNQYCTSSYYAGVIVLALAVTAVWLVRRPRVWLLGALCLLTLVLALGERGYVYGWLQRVAPVLGLMRYPVKFVLVPTFVLPVLAAFGIERALSATPDERGRLWRRLVAVWVLLGALLLAILWFARFHPLHGPPFNHWPETMRNGLTRLGVLVLGGALLWLARRAEAARAQGLLRLGLLLAVFLDLLTHVPKQNPTVARWVYQPGLLQLSPAPAVGSTRAMTSPAAELTLHNFAATNVVEDVLFKRQGLYCDCNLIDRIPKVTGVFPLHLGKMEHFDAVLYQSAAIEYPAVERFLGVSHVSSGTNAMVWNVRTNFLPLVTAGQRPVFAADDQALGAVFAPDFDSRLVVYLPPEVRSNVSATGSSPVHLEVQRFTDHRIECETESEHPAMVVVAQAYYARWHARVDGRLVPLWRANYAYQALEVPGGRHRVTLTYEDSAFYAGGAISGTTAAVCLFAWYRDRRKGTAKRASGPTLAQREG